MDDRGRPGRPIRRRTGAAHPSRTFHLVAEGSLRCAVSRCGSSPPSAGSSCCSAPAPARWARPPTRPTPPPRRAWWRTHRPATRRPRTPRRRMTTAPRARRRPRVAPGRAPPRAQPSRRPPTPSPTAASRRPGGVRYRFRCASRVGRSSTPVRCNCRTATGATRRSTRTRYRCCVRKPWRRRARTSTRSAAPRSPAMATGSPCRRPSTPHTSRPEATAPNPHPAHTVPPHLPPSVCGMRVTMILPALTEATSPFFRPIKYSLFPPLGLATLAGYLRPDDEVRIFDEHVQRLPLDEDRPDLVVIQAYITSARRSYELADAYRARGVFVAMGGLHVTSLPDEAAAHADAIFLGPGEDTWPVFLDDFRRGEPRARYVSTTRTLEGLPPIRRDLIQRHRYLVPNSIVVSRGCPHHCDFCYKDAFFEGGKSFYTQRVDDALAEIDRLPGRHLYFLDDHLFGNRRFASALFDGMAGTGRVWQAAGTVDAVLAPGLLEQAVQAGLRSMFVGFETVNAGNLAGQRKRQNIGRDYAAIG